MASSNRHPIRVVSRRTGLSPHVIRAWERRYGAVKPQRTRTNRRLYTDEDVRRLQLLRRGVAEGRSIGQIARLSTDELSALIADDSAATADGGPAVRVSGGGDSVAALLAATMEAVKRLDARQLEEAFSQAAKTVTQPVLMEGVILPLLERIGDLWEVGDLRVAHEHVASVIVRNFLGQLSAAHGVHPAAPPLIAGTPAGQFHEFGALVAAATAASCGWHVTYFGSNLPAEEIAAVADRREARAIVLSVVYPPDDPHLAAEFTRLRRLCVEEKPIIVGGKASKSYSDVLSTIGAVRLDDMEGLRVHLRTMAPRRRR